jgi:hypothetical protein
MHAIGSTIMRAASKPAAVRNSIQTLVAIRTDGRWALAAFQNTRLQPMSASFAAVLLWNVTDWFWKLVLRTNGAKAAS